MKAWKSLPWMALALALVAAPALAQDVEPQTATEAAEFQSGLNVTSYAVQPASFAKLREISAAWQVPTSWTRAIGASAATITLSGRNLHTWSDWTSLDPETFWLTNQFDKSNQTFTPQLAQFVTSIKLTF